MDRTLYDILGVSETATTAEIRSAYHKLAKEYHPDVSRKKNTEEMFKKISAAYEVLKDRKQREAYDRKLQEERENERHEQEIEDVFDEYFNEEDQEEQSLNTKVRLGESGGYSALFFMLLSGFFICTMKKWNLGDKEELSYFASFVVFCTSLNFIVVRWMAVIITNFILSRHGMSAEKPGVQRSVKGSSTITKTVIIFLLSCFVSAFLNKKINVAVVSYAFSDGDNAFLNAFVNFYTDAQAYVFAALFLLVNLLISFIIICYGLNKYTCPKCGIPFSFFLEDTYETDCHTFYKREQKSVNGRLRYVRVAYERYTYNEEFECEECAYRLHVTSQKERCLE